MEHENIDVSTLTHEDLQDEYHRLLKRHQQMHEINESDNQRIYELKRNLETALAAQEYLTQELEQLSGNGNSNKQPEHIKLQEELDEVKRKQTALNVEYSTLQLDFEQLQEDNAELKEKLLAASSKPTEFIAEPLVDNKLLERTHSLEGENLELIHKLEDYQQNSIQQTMVIAEKERNIEILNDQVVCLEENLKSKREELDEKNNLLESTQEQLAEANAQIAMLTSAPENNDRKGNSLFAEVDDQRQVMKKLLADQKKSYLQMKKVFNESEFEIRRLKRENTAMHTELQACISIFCAADKTYQDKLNERIRQLATQNDDLEKQLRWTHDRLKELANEKGVLWLDSMLNFCKQETDVLKKQMHSVRIQIASLEEQLRNSQHDMARWRFESLKSRCVLLDRENLLNEHKIAFKPVNALEYRITPKQLEEARPRIISENRPPTPLNMKNILHSSSNSPSMKNITPTKIENENQNPTEIIELNDTMKTPLKSKVGFKIFQDSIKTEQPMQIESTNNSKTPAEIIELNDTLKTPLNSKVGFQIFQDSIKSEQSMQLENSNNLENPAEIIELNDTIKTPVTSNIGFPIFQDDSIQIKRTTPLKTCHKTADTINLCINNKENINIGSSQTPNALDIENNIPDKKSPTIQVKSFADESKIKKSPHFDSQPGPSILSRHRDFLTCKDSHKNVQFSSKGVTVHNLSSHETSVTENLIKKEKNSQTTVTQLKTKSNIIVRKVVIKSKQGTNN